MEKDSPNQGITKKGSSQASSQASSRGSSQGSLQDQIEVQQLKEKVKKLKEKSQRKKAVILQLQQSLSYFEGFTSMNASPLQEGIFFKKKKL